MQEAKQRVELGLELDARAAYMQTTSPAAGWPSRLKALCSMFIKAEIYHCLW